MSDAQTIAAAQAKLRAAWNTKIAAVRAFIQFLKDQIAAAPTGVLTAEQATAVEAEMASLESEIAAEPEA